MYFQTWKQSEKNQRSQKEYNQAQFSSMKRNYRHNDRRSWLSLLYDQDPWVSPFSAISILHFPRLQWLYLFPFSQNSWLAFTLPFFTSTVAKTAFETRWMPSSSLFGSNAHGSHWYSKGTWCDTTWISKLPFHRWPPKQGITKESSNTTSNANSKGWCKKYPSKKYGSFRIEAKKLSLIRKVLIKRKSFNITERSCKYPSKHYPRTTQFSFIEGLLKVFKVHTRKSKESS